MKKLISFLVIVVLLVALGGGGYLAYQTTTPEYALKKTMDDVNANGLDGLETHVTSDIWKGIQQIKSLSENSWVSMILSSVSDKTKIDTLVSKISEVQWTVEDVMKGKQKAEVVLGFNYQDQLTGKINVVMIPDGKTWVISGIDDPALEKFF